MARTIGELGEKALIRTIIKPILNPGNNPNSIGDDAAVLKCEDGVAMCVSTDRVPADLISFRLGLIDYNQLGYYLAVLNLSDMAAMGASPAGLLLNLGLPSSFAIDDFRELLLGAARACSENACTILGGDLSTAQEMSISATSLGFCKFPDLLRRTGCRQGDVIYCSGFLGLTSTAFNYYLRAKPAGMQLSDAHGELLANQFRKPAPRFDFARQLCALRSNVTCMDNTDGAAQTLSELAELNALSYVLDAQLLPIHPVTLQVAEFLKCDPIDVALGAGADFNLLGTFPRSCSEMESTTTGLHLIGEAEVGSGLWLRTSDTKVPLTVKGWDYFATCPFECSNPEMADAISRAL